MLAGDVVWVDTGINLHDARRTSATWIVGAEPDDHQRASRAWRTSSTTLEVVGRERRQPTSCAELEHGAAPGSRTSTSRTASAPTTEMPFVGTDLGDTFDESLIPRRAWCSCSNP
jgi:hypothetical protein